MLQSEAETTAYRNAAYAVLRGLINNVDEHDVADRLHLAAGDAEAWALEKHLEWQTEPEMVDRVCREMTELLDLIEPYLGGNRTEIWKTQWMADGRDMGRQDHPDEATARAFYDNEIARVWPANPGADGGRNYRTHPAADPWVLQLRRILILTAVVDTADSTSNWPPVALEAAEPEAAGR